MKERVPVQLLSGAGSSAEGSVLVRCGGDVADAHIDVIITRWLVTVGLVGLGALLTVVFGFAYLNLRARDLTRIERRLDAQPGLDG